MKHEFGKYLLDCSKIAIGGIVLTRIVKKETISDDLLIVVGLSVALVTLIGGLILINNSKK